MNKIIIFIILISIFGCGEKKNTIPKKENIKVVKSIELKEEKLVNIKNYNGTLKPKEEMVIITPTGGDVKKIYYKNGDRVKKGEIIAEIYNAGVEANYFEAQGQLLKAKSTYSTEKISFEKNSKLYKKELISENDYLNIKNRYESAQGELKIAEGRYIKARDEYERLKITSEIDGVVTDLFVKQYQRLGAGEKVVTVVNNSEMEVDIAIEGKDIRYSKLGNKAEVYVQELDLKREGVVEEINLSSDMDTKKYLLRILVNNEQRDILKGMYAKVTLAQGEVKGIFVPNKAVMIKDLYSYIAVIREGKATIYRVESKMTVGDKQLIEFADYKVGDRVVVEGQYLLNNNDKVKES